MIHDSRISACFDPTTTCPGHLALVDLPAETVEGIHRDVCYHCNANAPDTLETARGKFGCILLLPRIKALVRNENSRKMLYKYRWIRSTDPESSLRDHFDGRGYQEILNRYG